MELMRKMFKAEERLDGSQHHYAVGAGGVDVDNLHKYEKPFSPAAMFPLAPGQQSPAPYAGGYFDATGQRFHDQEHQMTGDHAKDVDSKAMLFPPPGYPFSPASMVRLAARKMEEDATVDSKPHPGLLKPMYNDRKLLQLNYLQCKTKSSLHKPTVNYRTTAADGRGYDDLSPQHEPLTPRAVGGAAAATGGFLLNADPDDYARYNFNVNNYSDTSKNEQPSPTPFLSNHSNHMNHVNSSNMNKVNHSNHSIHSKMNNSNKGGSNNNDYYYFNDAVEYNLSKSMKSDMAMADYEVAAARHSPSMSPRNKSGTSKHLLALNETKGKDTDLGDDEGTMHHSQLGAGQEDKTRSSGGGGGGGGGVGKTPSDDVDDDRDDEFMNL